MILINWVYRTGENDRIVKMLPETKTSHQIIYDAGVSILSFFLTLIETFHY